MIDHYATLGIAHDADHEAIKAAFRALAKKYHPDTAADPATAKTRFRELHEAHAVLSNPQSRADYDRLLSPQQFNQSVRKPRESAGVQGFAEAMRRKELDFEHQNRHETLAPVGCGSIIVVFALVMLLAIAQLLLGG